MTIAIEIHESMLGPFARREDAEAVGLAMIDKGWPIIYADNGTKSQWRFDTLADYRRFALDWDATTDELGRGGCLSIAWDCDCEEDGLKQCPHGDDPVQPVAENSRLSELYGPALEHAIEERYPGLRRYICASVGSLYGAIAWGLEFEEATGEPSASGLWLERIWPKSREGLQTYDRHLDYFAGFLNVARDDAWLSEHMASKRIDVYDLQRCPECDDFLGLFCECGGD